MALNQIEEEFFRFVYKRQLIWYKRFVLKEKPPWTNDEVLLKYKIINVYRELDKCTLYLVNKLKNIKNREKILINVIFYRFFNQFGLYENLEISLLDKIDTKYLEMKFSKYKENGLKIFNNAYLISSGKKGSKKHIEILQNLEKIDFKELIKEVDNSGSLGEASQVLQKIPLVGPFLANEIITDLTYFDFFRQKWTDNDIFYIGPGAKWGLEIIYSKKLGEKEQEEKLIYLYNIQDKMLENINNKVKEPLTWKEIAYKNAFSHYPFLSLTNIESSLCEFRKYWNIKNGRGRRKYFKPQIL
ncbi:MAG: nucleotide kinase domain-containing protein [Nanoarchaeota archaeon]